MSRQYEVYVNNLQTEMKQVQMQNVQLLQLCQQLQMQMDAGFNALVSRIEILEDGETSQPAHANGKVKKQAGRKADR